MKETIEVSTMLKLVVPSMPNFIRVEDSDQTLHVSKITDDTVEKICEAWPKAFRSHVKRSREMNRRLSK